MTPSSLRALVAEDDRALADILRIALVKAGFEVIVSHHGGRALQIARETSFDVVVTDYQMPGLNGEEVLRGIRSMGASQHAVCVLCSAKSYELNSERLQAELNLAGVFYKPFSLAEIVATIRNASASVC